jgi:hypothetical protein
VLQHVLIWVAATVSILIGTVWGQSLGFLSHRTERRALAWLVLTLFSIFAGALVQRAPTAVAALVLVSLGLAAFGLWLLTDGAAAAGGTYVAIAVIYLIVLGPACYRWLTERPS